MSSKITHSLTYRPEIDGLRALAVLPVILFHAGFSLFSGGFVGVDIFFVISGYLITSIILKDLQAGRFSIATFYERRARRILPALMVVLVVCLPFAFWLMLPEELKRFGQSLIAVATFSSNLFFWLKTDYFAPAAEEQPLLHTWSLAVEEQYYLFFPILLMLAWKGGKRRMAWLVAALAVGSFALACWTERAHPQAAFYLLPTRAWELLAGSLIAMIPASFVQDRLTPRMAQAGSATGFAMILWAMATFQGHGPADTARMAIPVLGSALVILTANPRTAVGVLLSNRLAVGVGLISYSAYLWHQPVLAFAKLKFFDGAPDGLMAMMVVLSLALGYLSWRFIELPTRTGNLRALRERGLLLGGSAGALAATMAVGVALHLSTGFAGLHRWDGIRAALQASNERSSGEKFCHEHPLKSALGPVTCIIGKKDAPVEGVLWGDSLAGALLPGLHEQLAKRGAAYVAVLSDGCIPVEGIARTKEIEFGCDPQRHTAAVDEIIRQPSLKTVVWIGNFALLTGGKPLDYVIDGAPATPATVRERMLATAHRLEAAGKRLVLIGNTPQFSQPAADYAMRMYARNGAGVERQTQYRPRAEVERGFGNLAEVLREIRPTSQIIDGLDVFCPGGQCGSHDAAGRLLYTDALHLSHQGARTLARAVVGRIDERTSTLAAAPVTGSDKHHGR